MPQVHNAGNKLGRRCDMCSNYEKQLQGVQVQEAETRDQVSCTRDWRAVASFPRTRGNKGSLLPSLGDIHPCDLRYAHCISRGAHQDLLSTLPLLTSFCAWPARLLEGQRHPGSPRLPLCPRRPAAQEWPRRVPSCGRDLLGWGVGRWCCASQKLPGASS